MQNAKRAFLLTHLVLLNAKWMQMIEILLLFSWSETILVDDTALLR